MFEGGVSCMIIHGALSDFHQLWIFSADFRRSFQYQISRKSVHLEPRCYIRTDMAKWRLSLLCERALLFHLCEARNCFPSRSWMSVNCVISVCWSEFSSFDVRYICCYSLYDTELSRKPNPETRQPWRLTFSHIVYLECKVLNVRVDVRNDVPRLSYFPDFERIRNTCKPYSKFPMTLFI